MSPKTPEKFRRLEEAGFDARTSEADYASI